LLGWALLGEHFASATLIGGALVVTAIIGLLMCDQRPGKREAEGERSLPAPLGRQARHPA
jgi:hypothetical protein